MDADILIIGAGVVGLAIAAEAAPLGELLILEREDRLGRGISSRNSEVLHGGLYYEPGSLKARCCVEGRRLVEAWAAQGRFGYQRLGKFIVATSREEEAGLSALLERGRLNGVEGLRLVSPDELREAEPAVRAEAALWSPATAIVDSHGLMRFLWERAAARGAQLVPRSRVVNLRPVSGGWEVEVEEGAWPECREDPAGPLPHEIPVHSARTLVSARTVIIAAGLHSDQLAAQAGLPVEELGLRQYWSRAEYFAPRPGSCPPLHHLVYPVPPADGEGHLGIHVTLDLSGSVRFGPSAEWLDPPQRRREDFAQGLRLREEFARGLARFLPGLDAADLQPAGVGLRPRLRPARDFVIRLEDRPGQGGLVTLLGVESPGLTSAPAIATRVADWLRARTRG